MPWLISKLSEFRIETRFLHVSFLRRVSIISWKTHEGAVSHFQSVIPMLTCHDSFLWVTHKIPELCEYFKNDAWRSCVSILRWYAMTHFYILTCHDSFLSKTHEIPELSECFKNDAWRSCVSILRWHATTHFYILTCHDSFLYIDMPWLIFIKDSFLGWNDSMTSLCVPYLISMRDMTYSYVTSLIDFHEMIDTLLRNDTWRNRVSFLNSLNLLMSHGIST